MRGMPRDGGVDFALLTLHLAADNRVVNLFDFPAGELSGERDVGVIVLGDDQATAGLFVEPMDDTWPGDPPDAAEFPGTMVEQRIDERMLFMAGRRMHDQAGRFVEHQQSVV